MLLAAVMAMVLAAAAPAFAQATAEGGNIQYADCDQIQAAATGQYNTDNQQNERMRQHILTLEQQIKVEEEKNVQLATAIQNLQSDPKTVERIAREKLGYAKPGETVIYFEAPQPVFR